MSYSRESTNPAWLETLPRYVVWVREHFSDDGEFQYKGLVAEEHPEGIYVKYADVLAACPPPCSGIHEEDHARMDKPVNPETPLTATTSESHPTGGPIHLTTAQRETAKEWAADDRLWTTQEAVETNLLVFTRVVLSGLVVCPTHGDPLVCLACEAEEEAHPVWSPPVHRVTPPRLRGEPPDMPRLIEQFEAISRMLSDAGIGPCTLSEGVRDLALRAAASPPPAEARDWQPISDVQPQDGQDYPVTAERAGEFMKEPSR